MTSRPGADSVLAQGNVVMAIDADPAAPGIQNCTGGVSLGSDVDVDLLIQNVADIDGFGMRLVYDSGIASIQATDRSVSILGSSGFDVGDPLPDTSNSYLDGYAGATAVGGGILTRYTIRAEAAGLTRLHLVVGNVDTSYVDSSLITRLPDQAQDALLSVGAPCPDAGSDRDGDGVLDLGADGTPFTSDDDNCPSTPNPAQQDRDSDTLGNACDPVVMTIDTDPSARKIQSCRGGVTDGSAVDLVIRSADVNSFQLRMAYDNSVVSYDSRNVGASVLGTGGLEDGGPPDATGRLFHSYAGTGVVVPHNGILMRYSLNTVEGAGTRMTRLSLINGPLDSAWVDIGLNFNVADQTPLAYLVVGGACPAAGSDSDGDGHTDYADTCPNVSDPGQGDLDGDAIGDACDADDENDSVLDAGDNCPRIVNTDQADNDADGQPGVHPGADDTFGGDACDPDDDNDGIDDGIDGPGQSFTFSNGFSDGPGGTTFGTIVGRAGLSVRVRDEADPTGVRIKASGSGGPAVVSVCDLAASLLLNPGNETVVTCGSSTVQVVSGPVTMKVGAFLEGKLPTGTTVTAQKTGAAITVCNSAGSSTSVTFTGIPIAPNSCRTDNDGDGFFNDTEVFIGTNADSACGAGAWPPDTHPTLGVGEVDVFDIPPLKEAYGTVSGQHASYSARVDFNASNDVNITDVAIFKRFFGLSCL